MSDRLTHLYEVKGTVRKSGIDKYGNAWLELDTALGDPETGWLCMDGGDFTRSQPRLHKGSPPKRRSNA